MEFKCAKCDSDLTLHSKEPLDDLDNNLDYRYIVNPCEKCAENIQDKAYKDGYDDGYDEGQNY